MISFLTSKAAEFKGSGKVLADSLKGYPERLILFGKLQFLYDLDGAHGGYVELALSVLPRMRITRRANRYRYRYRYKRQGK